MKFILPLMAVLCTCLGTTSSAAEPTDVGKPQKPQATQIDWTQLGNEVEAAEEIQAFLNTGDFLLFGRNRSNGGCGSCGEGYCGSGGFGGGFGGGSGAVWQTAGGVDVSMGLFAGRYQNGRGLVARLDAWDQMRFPDSAGSRFPGHRLLTLSQIGLNASGIVANIYGAGAFSAIAGRRGQMHGGAGMMGGSSWMPRGRMMMGRGMMMMGGGAD